ncbi:hypothetical protein M413DRAFT_141211 [Hebeloma cylindrosporum]|uniref:Uncharacterized protein n=1 Tax=Hebeloma cylindrosporum TaxID=76867 RepID=A0A0C2YLN7_HEBCY|nr:hypothetical protein M413DRAFT_141211 [Hebeloma cylindrosporum h7]
MPFLTEISFPQFLFISRVLPVQYDIVQVPILSLYLLHLSSCNTTDIGIIRNPTQLQFAHCCIILYLFLVPSCTPSYTCNG